MANSPAAIMERVREIHRSYQDQIEAKRTALKDSSTTSFGRSPSAEAKRKALPSAVRGSSNGGTCNEKSVEETTAVDSGSYQKYYAPNSFVGQWLDLHPETTLRDVSAGESKAPLKTLLGVPAKPLPVAEPAGFAGFMKLQQKASGNTFPSVENGGEYLNEEGESGGGKKRLFNTGADAGIGTGLRRNPYDTKTAHTNDRNPSSKVDLEFLTRKKPKQRGQEDGSDDDSRGGEDQYDAVPEEEGEAAGGLEMAELAAISTAAEVTEWLKAVRELQTERRTAADDWSVAEQQQVEAMVREELSKAQEAAKVEDERGYHRMLLLQEISERLGAISRRKTFEEMPASDATIEEWLEALREKVEDWYLNRKDTTASGDGGAGGRNDAKSTASRKPKLNQISTGLASAAAHEGLLLTAQQLDQVLQAFYQQDKRRAMLPGSSGNGVGGGGDRLAPSPATQRDVTRLRRQVTETMAREDAVRRVLGQRNRALLAEIARLHRVIEVAAGYVNASMGAGEVAETASASANAPIPLPRNGNGLGTRGVSFSVAPSGAGNGGGADIVQMLADHHSSAASQNEDYGLASLLRNRSAVESLNSITFVVAEALSRRRMRILQAQVDKLRAALVSMKAAYTSASERLKGLGAENATLRSELEDFTGTFAAWKAIRDKQETERRRLAKEGGTELSTQKEVMNLLIQRTTSLLSQVVGALAEVTTCAVATNHHHGAIGFKSEGLLAATPRAAVLRRPSYNSNTTNNNNNNYNNSSAFPQQGNATMDSKNNSAHTTRRPSLQHQPRPHFLPFNTAGHDAIGSEYSSRRGSLQQQQQQPPSNGTSPRRITSQASIGSSKSTADSTAFLHQQHSEGSHNNAGDLLHQPPPVSAIAKAATSKIAKAISDWVAFAKNTIPSDTSRMLLSDLGHRSQTLQAKEWGPPKNDAVSTFVHGAANTNTINVMAVSPPAIISSSALVGGESSEDGVVESLSHRLDQTICEVKDKIREERFMRRTIKYFTKCVEEMVAGTYKEDPAFAEDDEAKKLRELKEGTGTTLLGIKSPLEKLKPAANIKVVKTFPPKPITSPDSEYAYAWTDETAALQSLFAQLKTALTHEVERTETTNAIVGALERYHLEGPAFKTNSTEARGTHPARGATNEALLPPLGMGAVSTQQQQSPFAARTGKKSIFSDQNKNMSAALVGDPMGLLDAVQKVNAREEQRSGGLSLMSNNGNGIMTMRGVAEAASGTAAVGANGRVVRSKNPLLTPLPLSSQPKKR